METTSVLPARQSGTFRAALLVLLVFIVGLVLGAGGAFFVFRHMAQVALSQSAANANVRVDKRLRQVEEQITWRLNLTPAEQAMVHEELMVTGGEFKADREMFVGEVHNLARDTVERIARHLPPAKAQKLRIIAQRRLSPWGVELNRPGAGESPAP